MIGGKGEFIVCWTKRWPRPGCTSPSPGWTKCHIAPFTGRPGSRVKSKMARERASSAITPLTETTLFVGPKTPDEIKRMIPHLIKIDKALFRKILQGRLSQYLSKLST